MHTENVCVCVFQKWIGSTNGSQRSIYDFNSNSNTNHENTHEFALDFQHSLARAAHIPFTI